MNITFNNCYGTMPLENEIRSIFDHIRAGQIDVKENYYCIMLDHNTEQYYAITPEKYHEVYESGYALKEYETAIFFGEKVRGMSIAEEIAYNEDRLYGNIDLWGNIEK